MYLNRNKILSYNASLNFIVLKRGYGKSWTFKDLCISEFLKDGSESVWVRRYKPELSATMPKFFDDIKERYPNHKFTIKGKTAYCDNKPFIHFIVLATAQNFKSTPFSNVKRLIFDEFIIESGSIHYIPNECNTFCSLLSTVFRDRPIKAYLLGNKVKQITPYNIYFELPNFDGNKYLKERKTLLYCGDNDNNIETNYEKSDLSIILKGTQYYDYSLMNKSLDDNSDFVEKRPNELLNQIIFNINGTDIGLFLDPRTSKVYFDIKCDKSVKLKYCYNKNNLSESYFLFSKTLPIGKMLKDMYNNGRIYYNDIKSKAIALEMLNSLV